MTSSRLRQPGTAYLLSPQYPPLNVMRARMDVLQNSWAIAVCAWPKRSRFASAGDPFAASASDLRS